MRLFYQCGLLILVLAVGGLLLRLPQLARRPMHCDEAVHAEKFGRLLEGGDYRYDPFEYHGPTLNYFTLIPARLCSCESYPQVDGFIIRVVPVVFGTVLILLPVLLMKGLGPVPAVAAALLTAVSPAMVYYSRYYIQEMLLVTFLAGFLIAGYRYLLTRRLGWALISGVCLGLAHASKETDIIALGCSFAALILCALCRGPKRSPDIQTPSVKAILIFILSASVISILFFSSFFKNPAGLLDSVRTYTTYFNRAGAGLHVHPWYWYLHRLIFFRLGDGPLWSEAIIFILACIGILAGFKTSLLPEQTRPGLIRFLSFYTLLMILVYSAVPYKTPWCALGFLHGLILLAGVGLIVLLKRPFRPAVRVPILLLCLAGLGHLVWQSGLANYRYEADPVNPYVYAHTCKDIYSITRQVLQAARAHPDQEEMYIQVLSGQNIWPLPWYLRSFKRVLWSKEVPEGLLPAPVILATPEMEEEIIEMMYQNPPPGQKEMYLPLFEESYLELRPQVQIRGYIAKSLWDRLQQQP